MARPLRLQFPGALYHLTARGNACQDIYLDATDRHTFLRLLGREVQQHRWHCYAYCLMSNHYHLPIETPEGDLVLGMRRLNGVYSQVFNRRHGRVGHVLQGRYTSIVVDRGPYLLELCRYIVLNPVRARMDAMVWDHAWADGTSAQTQPLRPTPAEVLQQVSAIYDVAREDLLNRAHQPAFQTLVHRAIRKGSKSSPRVHGPQNSAPYLRYAALRHHERRSHGADFLRLLESKPSTAQLLFTGGIGEAVQSIGPWKRLGKQCGIALWFPKT